ncbi:uncharacterized protein LOC107268647 isoform X2 [Cephus cinctus]|nr:uncharacterized protein LOC107268647 isoform X2 [Cephus cinctus]
MVRQSYDTTRRESCARCDPPMMQFESREASRRKRKTKNHLQHCPSCHCPPYSMKYSPARTRNTENVYALLDQYEQFLAKSMHPGRKLQSPRSPRSASRCRPSTIVHCSRKGNSGGNQQLKTTETDPILQELMRDMVKTGLADEDTKGYPRYECAPIKSIHKKDNSWQQQQDESDEESIRPIKHVHDYPHTKKQSSVESQKRDGTSQPIEKYDIQKDEEWKQLQRDREELNELDSEVREFEKWKNIRQEDKDANTTEKRKVNFLPSKLPVPQFSNVRPGAFDTSRSKSPKDQAKDRVRNVEASTSYHSMLTADKNLKATSEFMEQLDLTKDENLEQELKSIPYCETYRCPSLPNSQSIKPKVERPSTDNNLINDNQADANLTEKNVYAGGGDLDFHSSKCYIVDLIDRALSRELATIPQEKKLDDLVGQREITRTLQGDCCQSLPHCLSNQETPDYVRQLKVLRWAYLNHIQDELRKLQDLERFLDTCSPRQSLPILHAQTTTSDTKREHMSTP